MTIGINIHREGNLSRFWTKNNDALYGKSVSGELKYENEVS